MPARIAAATRRGSACSKACGITSRNAAPSSAPMAYDTSAWIHAARKNSDSAAAQTESAPPAMLATTIHPRTGIGAGIILRQPDRRGHAFRRLLSPVGIEPRRVRGRAKAAAADALHAQRAEALLRNRIEIQQPVAGPVRGE